MANKKKIIKNQKGGEAELIVKGFTEKGPLGLEVGTNGSPMTTVNNAIATAFQIPVAVFKTIDFVVAAATLPADLGHAYTMDNPPDTTNMKLMGGKKSKRR